MTKKNDTKAAPAAAPALTSKTFAPVQDTDGKVVDWASEPDWNDVGFRLGDDA